MPQRHSKQYNQERSNPNLVKDCKNNELIHSSQYLHIIKASHFFISFRYFPRIYIPVTLQLEI